ncbi:hypothetical protein MC885_001971, partial [Smutsia gigantea]
MQVHYLKGYFLLRFLARRLGDDTYFTFLRRFVHTFHGQLILSQDFLQMLLENIPEERRLELSVENILRDWLESSGIPQPLAGFPEGPVVAERTMNGAGAPRPLRQAPPRPAPAPLRCRCGGRGRAAGGGKKPDRVRFPAAAAERAPGRGGVRARAASERRGPVVFGLQVAKWIRANRRPRKRKRREAEVFEEVGPRGAPGGPRGYRRRSRGSPTAISGSSLEFWRIRRAQWRAVQRGRSPQPGSGVGGSV